MNQNISMPKGMNEKVLQTLQDMQRELTQPQIKPEGGRDEKGLSFTDHLKHEIKEINAKHQVADRMGTEIATGRSGNIHETMLAASQAELGFNLMVQVRNKALEAYTEVMRMQV